MPRRIYLWLRYGYWRPVQHFVVNWRAGDLIRCQTKKAATTVAAIHNSSRGRATEEKAL